MICSDLEAELYQMRYKGVLEPTQSPNSGDPNMAAKAVEIVQKIVLSYWSGSRRSSIRPIGDHDIAVERGHRDLQNAL